MGAARYLAHVPMTVERHHLMQKLNHAMDKARRALQEAASGLKKAATLGSPFRGGSWPGNGADSRTFSASTARARKPIA